MAIVQLVAPRAILLTPANPTVESPPLAIDKLTGRITIRIQRPTTASPLNWLSSGVMRVGLLVVLDGLEHRCLGQASGGVKQVKGVDAPEYRLTWLLTVFNDVGILRRIGETSRTSYVAFIRLRRLAGRIETNLLGVEAESSPASRIMIA